MAKGGAVGGGADGCRGGRLGGNSVLLTGGIIVADVVGAGILSIPNAIASFGWLLGSAMMVLMMALNVHISILIWRACMYYEGVRTTQELAASAFSLAPEWQRSAVATIAATSQQCFMFCVLGLYVLSFGEGLGTLFCSARLCMPVWMLLAGAALLPFAGTSRQMGGWSSLVYINVASLSGTIFIPLAYMAYVGTDEMRPEGSQVYAVAPLTVGRCLEALGTTTFAFSSQFIIPEIIAEMKSPAKLPQAYCLVAMPFMMSAFLIVGVGAYYYMGDQISGMILDTLPFGVPLRAAACCLMLHMLISYLIKNSVFCNFILALVEAALGSEKEEGGERRWRSWILWNAIVVLALAAAWTFANVVPFFADLVSLLGASLTPLSCYVLPILMFARWYRDSGHAVSHVSRWEWLLILLELLLALVLMVFGTAMAVQQIMEHWQTYGYPFQCHCENMWDTCECSAQRPGMTDICPANSTAATLAR